MGENRWGQWKENKYKGTARRMLKVAKINGRSRFWNWGINNYGGNRGGSYEGKNLQNGLLKIWGQ